MVPSSTFLFKMKSLFPNICFQLFSSLSFLPILLFSQLHLPKKNQEEKKKSRSWPLCRQPCSVTLFERACIYIEILCLSNIHIYLLHGGRFVVAVVSEYLQCETLRDLCCLHTFNIEFFRFIYIYMTQHILPLHLYLIV